MIELADVEQRRAFLVWLRTGRLSSVRNAEGIELKFNPWHDPDDGRFTFVGGGRYFGRSGSGNGTFADRAGHYPQPKSGRSENTSAAKGSYTRASGSGIGSFGKQTGVNATVTADAIIDERVRSRADGAAPATANQARPPARPGPAVGRGGNSRAFEDPMTLEQSFPGLRNAPAGAVIAAADYLFDLTGPRDTMTGEVLQDQAKRLTAEISALNPAWHYDEVVPTDALGNPIRTVQGLSGKVNELRFQRAAMIARLKSDYAPLQVETVRFVQQRADDAYDRGSTLLKAGRLRPRLSDQEALGNYVDQQVRRNLRERYNQLGIDSAGVGPVRVNRRENITSGSGDLAYRRPDMRVQDVAIDVTLTRKTLGTAQVRGFFNANFRPNRVVIIRPSQLGTGHTYVIARPRTK
jgi:hypothetical protein